MSIGQTHNRAQFCGDPTRSVRNNCNRKFALPEKVGQNSPKALKTCYPSMPNFIEFGETALKKIVTKFFHPSIFWLPWGTSWPIVTGLGGGLHQPPLATCKILSRSDDPSLLDICCQTSSILLPV